MKLKIFIIYHILIVMKILKDITLMFLNLIINHAIHLVKNVIKVEIKQIIIVLNAKKNIN